MGYIECILGIMILALLNIGLFVNSADKPVLFSRTNEHSHEVIS